VINSHRNLFTYILVLATLLSLTSGPLALVSSAEGLLHSVLDKVKGGDHKDSGDGDHKDSGDGDKDSDEKSHDNEDPKGDEESDDRRDGDTGKGSTPASDNVGRISSTVEPESTGKYSLLNSLILPGGIVDNEFVTEGTYTYWDLDSPESKGTIKVIDNN
jgi:hypothetical protein